MSINFGRIAKFLGAKNFTSEDVLQKGLEKISPKFQGFFDTASKAGYPIGAALGFLQSQFSSRQAQDSSLRPDIAANQALLSQSNVPGQVLGAIGKTALGAGLGGVGSAAVSALGGAMGQSQQQGQPGQQQQQPQQEEQRSYDPLAGFKDYPELTKFIRKEHASGGNAESIASKARKHSKLSSMVTDIERKAGEEFESLLGRLLGGGQRQQSQQQQINPAMTELLGALKQLQAMSGQGG